MRERFTCDALILAAGRGTRFGGPLPKQYLPLAQDTVLSRAVEAFTEHPEIRHVVVVGPSDDDGEIGIALGRLAPLVTVVAGGETRQASANKGLAALPPANEDDAVLIHDAARPFVSAALISRVVGALVQADAVIPALPVADTLKRVEGQQITVTVPREGLVQAQTPQGFRTALLRAAHRESARSGHSLTDDAGVMEQAGHPVVWVAGERTNHKLTTPDDMPIHDKDAAPMMCPRVGQGFDVHRLGDGGPMILGGLTLDVAQHLVGHSDADVALHAITDAMFGAIADGDIGSHFPPTDETWRGASSDIFLAHAAQRCKARGVIAHIDLTIICERPKIGPHREAMRERIAEIAGVPVSRVAVKATTTEKLGFPGRGEGIAAQAAVTVLVKDDSIV